MTIASRDGANAPRLILLPALLLLLSLALVPSCDPSPSTNPEPDAGASPASPAAPRAGVSGETRQGLYRVVLHPRDGAIPLNEIHAWVVEVSTADGERVRPTRLSFDGGMPQHRHGFVTRPQVTRVLPDGSFLVDGVKFHMPGEWTLRVELVGPRGPDVADLQLRVEP